MRYPRCTRAITACVLLVPASATAAPLFAEDPGAFGTQSCNGSECWTNYLRVTDFDGDGDLDAVFPNYSGFFSQGTGQLLLLYENDGQGNFIDVSETAVGGYSARLRQIAFGDVDGDGDIDMYAPDGWGGADAFFVNDGMGVFTDQAAQLLPGVQSRAGAVRFADVDDDGDLDLWVADGYGQGNAASTIAHLYLNDGTGHFTDASDRLPATWQGVDPDDFDVLDVDRDWDLDLFINMHEGKSTLYVNDGTGHFTDGSSNIPAPASSNFHYGPSVCDVDGDGDLDIWIDNIGGSFREQLLINDGTGKFTDETNARVTNNPGADDNGVQCADVDGDGDLDAIVVSLAAEERVLENDGTGKFNGAGTLADAIPGLGDPSLWAEFGDLDGDKRLDLVTAQGESFGQQWEERVYFGTMNAPIDTRPPKIIAVDPAPAQVGASDPPPVVHFAVSDNAVTDEGPRLQSAMVKVTGPENKDVTAFFMGGDLFRAELPAVIGGTYTYEICVTDRAGNEACDRARMYLAEGGTTTSDTDAGTTGTDTDATSITDGGTDTTTGTAGTTATGSGTGDETESSTTENSDGESGCDCRSATGGGSAGLALLLAWASSRRRRNQGRR